MLSSIVGIAQTHSCLIPAICDDNGIDIQLHKRVIKFISSAMKSQNIVVNTCINLAINGSRSELSNSINLICFKYKICKYKLNVHDVYKCVFEDDLIVETKASIVRETFCR